MNTAGRDDVLAVQEVVEQVRTMSAKVRRWLRPGRLRGMMPGGTSSGLREHERLADGEGGVGGLEAVGRDERVDRGPVAHREREQGVATPDRVRPLSC